MAPVLPRRILSCVCLVATHAYLPQRAVQSDRTPFPTAPTLMTRLTGAEEVEWSRPPHGLAARHQDRVNVESVCPVSRLSR